jgi:hypothetical protein
VGTTALTGWAAVDIIGALVGTARLGVSRMKSLLVAGVFLALVVSAPGASAQAQTSFYHCWYRVDAQNGPPWGTIYSSEVFGTTVAAGTIASDWYKYVVGTYPVGSGRQSGTCESFSAQAAQQQYSLSMEEKNWTSSALTIVHVNYAPGDGAKVPPPKPAAPAAPPAAAPSGPMHHYYCVSKPGQAITYFSAVFDTPETDARILASKFDMFLQTKYHRKTNGLWSCPESPSSAAAQADEQKQIDQLHATNQQVVETGWTYGAP